MRKQMLRFAASTPDIGVPWEEFVQAALRD